MKYCPFCGAGLQDEMVFCPKCGKRFQGAVEDTQTKLVQKSESNVAESTVTVQTVPVRPKKFWRPLAVVLACLVVIAAVIGIVWTVSQPEEPPEESPAPTPVETPVVTVSEQPEEETISITQAAESVLYLEVYDENEEVIGSASGFVIEDGKTVVTNYHVIEDAYHITAWTAQGERWTDAADVLAFDEEADLAILKLERTLGVDSLVLHASDTVQQGDKVFVVGYPLGLANTMSDGIVGSRYVDENGIDVIQITAPISGGSSGGALFDEDGYVIGVICAYYVDGQNLNIAIASNVVSELIADGYSPVSLADFYHGVRPGGDVTDEEPTPIPLPEPTPTPTPTPTPAPTPEPTPTPVPTPEVVESVVPDGFHGAWEVFEANENGEITGQWTDYAPPNRLLKHIDSTQGIIWSEYELPGYWRSENDELWAGENKNILYYSDTVDAVKKIVLQSDGTIFSTIEWTYEGIYRIRYERWKRVE